MRSLFWKYLVVTVCLLLVCFGVFTTTFLLQTYNLTLGNSQTELEKQAIRLSEMTTIYIDNNTDTVQQMYYLNLNNIVRENDAYIVLADTSGHVVFCFDERGFLDTSDAYISEDALNAVLNEGKYSGIGDFSGSSDEAYYISGQPVYTANDLIVGVVFISSPATASFAFLDNMHRIFVATGLIVLLLGIFVSYFVAQSMSKPLKNMQLATRAYAKGDFSVRIDDSGDDEIGELARSFNSMSESLEQLESLRSSFIADVSHELKTPMTTISGFVDGMLDGTIPPEKQHDYLQIISNETRRLSRLVVRMLEASRIESGQVKLNPVRFDLTDLICQTVIGFEQRINEKKIDVQINFEKDSVFVYADQDGIAQVVYNLIDNATKFSSDEGTMSIAVSVTDKKAYVKIANDGQTIAPNVLSHIFDRFYKADQSRGKDNCGAGLGLFLCKSIINMHGEDINAMSENGRTEFVFTLSLAESL